MMYNFTNSPLVGIQRSPRNGQGTNTH